MLDNQRIIIIGNSGSGKTYLAQKISSAAEKAFHLDNFFWKPAGFNKKRPEALVKQELQNISEYETWIVEGVFGELAELFLERATCLIWLDMDWQTCKQNLLDRGSESSKQLNLEAADANFKALLAWASDYWQRNGPRSYSGHLKIYNNFVGQKYRLKTKSELSDFSVNF
jgi:adenylate kinase family enzyme